MSRIVLLLTLVLGYSACRPPVYQPKPSGYFKVDTPKEHQYEVFDRPDYPYSFEYPAGSIITNDTVFKEKNLDNKYWINIFIPSVEGIINITYKPITAANPLLKLEDESWGLSYLHHERADYINNINYTNPYGNAYTIYTVGGNTASRYQFAATDSTQHFLRGALYFDVTPNVDSLKPVTDFLLKDIKHMMNTLRWKKVQ